MPFAALNADPQVMEHLPAVLSGEESDRLAARIEAHFGRHGFGLWALEIPNVASFAGFVGLSVPSFQAHFTPCVEIGWRLAAEHWGRGYATEGARAVLTFGFQILEVGEIVSFTAPGNVRSRQVMERIGMIHDSADDFDHPALPEKHRLRRHVLYRIARPALANMRYQPVAAGATIEPPAAETQPLGRQEDETLPPDQYGITVAPYDPGWPAAFEAEAIRLRTALGALALRVDHHGSTAIPGLGAKPIIDIQVSVAALQPITTYGERLEALGYAHVPHPDDSFCPFFHRPLQWPHSHHVHVVERGGVEERRTLAFRDYLRDHSDVAHEYERLKHELARQLSGTTRESRDEYAHAKTGFIDRVVALAIQSGYPRQRL
jgi:GrpB-like predicted nucleotidyltransferase (UPF0157 family)/RimJ/RimL family protein N-acetyltransferase